mgnify:CR=1 FL=1
MMFSYGLPDILRTEYITPEGPGKTTGPSGVMYSAVSPLRLSVQRTWKHLHRQSSEASNNGLFPVLGAAVQIQQNSRFNAGLYRPVAVLRRRVPQLGEPLRAPLKKRIAMYFCNALLGLMLFGFQNHFSVSGKMILLTKKKITIDTPPFRTVVPML